MSQSSEDYRYEGTDLELGKGSRVLTVTNEEEEDDERRHILVHAEEVDNLIEALQKGKKKAYRNMIE